MSNAIKKVESILKPSFKEVMRNRKRLCDFYKNTEPGCKICPLQSDHMNCKDYMIEHPDKAMQLIMEFTAEHPFKSNLDKLLEVFPQLDKRTVLNDMHDNTSYLCFGIPCFNGVCEKCEKRRFWNDEYKEE